MAVSPNQMCCPSTILTTRTPSSPVATVPTNVPTMEWLLLSTVPIVGVDPKSLLRPWKWTPPIVTLPVKVTTRRTVVDPITF